MDGCTNEMFEDLRRMGVRDQGSHWAPEQEDIYNIQNYQVLTTEACQNNNMDLTVLNIVIY